MAFRAKGINRPNVPCASPGIGTTFIIPDANNVCSNDAEAKYQLVYLSPEVNFYEANSPMSTTGQTVTILENQYNVWAPNVEPDVSSNNVDLFFRTNSRPVNVCPQTYTSNTPNPGVIPNPSVVQLPLPLATSSKLRGNTNRPRVTREAIRSGPVAVQIFSGPPGSTQNVPAPISGLTKGLSSNVYIYAVDNATLFLELGGGRGGKYQTYSGAVNATTGEPTPLVPTYEGGAPGVVYGLWRMPIGSTIRAFLASQGTLTADPSLAPPYDGRGQGGLGTIFGGANGGGASYLMYYAPVPGDLNGSLNNAIANRNGRLIAVAAGGGGSSRNASGGPAGYFVDQFIDGGYTTLLYGAGVTTNQWGSAGGQNYVLGTAPSRPGNPTNQLSGGGGTNNSGGASNVPSPFPSPFSNFGAPLKPFLSSGGANVSTDVSSGGGGGGGGLYGGGAGGYNGIAKPNNVHGAGGGGSSTFGDLQPATTPIANAGVNGVRGATLNLYRESEGAISVWNPILDNSFGYLVVGIKSA